MQRRSRPGLEALRRRRGDARTVSLDGPLRLARRAGCRSLEDRRTDDGETEDVCAQLRPRVRRRSTSDERHLRGRDTRAAKRVQRVRESERHAFDDGIDDRVAPLTRAQADEHPGAIGSVRRAFAGEVGQERQAGRAPARDGGVDLRMVHREQLARPLRRARAVEGRGEREPTARRVAKCCGLAERVQGGSAPVGEGRAGGPETHRHRPLGEDVAADRGAHVVAASRAHRGAGFEPE